MFVLWNLIALCLRCVFALPAGVHQPTARFHTAQRNANLVTRSQMQFLVPIHAPTLRRHV